MQGIKQYLREHPEEAREILHLPAVIHHLHLIRRSVGGLQELFGPQVVVELRLEAPNPWVRTDGLQLEHALQGSAPFCSPDFLRSQLRLFARMRAIAQHANQTVTFNSSQDYVFGADTRNLGQLYPGTTITTATPFSVTFNTVGTTTLGADQPIALSNKGKTKSLTVTPIGRINIP